MTDTLAEKPELLVNAASLFGIDSRATTMAFESNSTYVPDLDTTYHFNNEVTSAILAGFNQNRRVLLQGLHG